MLIKSTIQNYFSACVSICTQQVRPDGHEAAYFDAARMMAKEIVHHAVGIPQFKLFAPISEDLRGVFDTVYFDTDDRMVAVIIWNGLDFEGPDLEKMKSIIKADQYPKPEYLFNKRYQNMLEYFAPEDGKSGETSEAESSIENGNILAKVPDVIVNVHFSQVHFIV